MSNIYSTTKYTEFTHLDLFYEEILGINANGSFIEIGAFDGETNSKTAHLADIGWRGIYLEPIKEYRDKCANRHKDNNINVLPFAISDKNEIVNMHKGGLPSTLKSSHQEHISNYTKLNSSELEFSDESVESLTWDKFVNGYVTKVPDVLVIDAEGFDLEIINSIDFKSFRPTIICCEIFPESTSFIHQSTIADGRKIIEKLTNNGYFIWLQEEHNILFSTKPIPKSISQINVSYPFLFDLANKNNKKANALSFFRQLLKTLILTKNIHRYEFLISIFANQTDDFYMADSNLLVLLLMAVNKESEAYNILKWSENNSEYYDISNQLLQILNKKSTLISYKLDRINQIIEHSPYDLRYVALRKLILQS